MFAALSFLLFFLLFVADIMTGSADISVPDVLRAIAGKGADPMARTIVLEIRLVRAVAAILAGVAVSVCGLLMQTFFRNPLAGPYVLGVNSGACLGAALFVLGLPSMASGVASGVVPAGTGIVLAQLGLAGAAWAGAAAVMIIVAWVSRRTRNIMTVLILGIMFGSGIDALVQLLQYFSNGETLKSYVLWTMGSLGRVTLEQLPLLCLATLAGLSMAAMIVKQLNLLLMGEEYAVTMGCNIYRTRTFIYIIIVLMAGTVTALCGPIGFIGLAVPHVARWLTGSADHRTVLPGTAMAGAVVMLLCDIAATSLAVPVNVLTSLLGVPIVVYIVLHVKAAL
ncbi:MAG: iron ABC transporter permease [Bacteroidales bacterium]|nr:iron ABC transporter permease [Bacteroidales bacterium]